MNLDGKGATGLVILRDDDDHSLRRRVETFLRTSDVVGLDFVAAGRETVAFVAVREAEEQPEGTNTVTLAGQVVLDGEVLGRFATRAVAESMIAARDRHSRRLGGRQEAE